ncbi:MAG: DUF502 domain-containing protein [Elusimicrobiota bacterium]
MSIRKQIKKQFVAGVVVILPLALTLWIVWAIFRFIGVSLISYLAYIPYVSDLPSSVQMGLSVVLTLFIIWIAGFWASNFAGKFFIYNIEKIFSKTPLVSKIYRAMKQLTNTMLVNRRAFKKVALIEYPRKGIGTMVFVTGENLESKSGNKLVTIFVPSTPNPTTGFCMIMPKEEVHELPLSVNQAVEFIFSAGIIVPEGMNIPDLLSVKKT